MADGEPDTVLRWHQFVEEVKAEITRSGHEMKGGLIDPASLGIAESSLSPAPEVVYRRRRYQSVYISVISPVYNRQRDLPGFLNSLAMQQATSPWELILVDDGIARVKELGGDLVNGPMDMDIGRFAVVRDPQGAVFALFSAKPS